MRHAREEVHEQLALPADDERRDWSRHPPRGAEHVFMLPHPPLEKWRQMIPAQRRVRQIPGDQIAGTRVAVLRAAIQIEDDDAVAAGVHGLKK
jgi:hypothetical protein